MATQATNRTVCRSCEACVGGVCAGLAVRFDLDPIVVRILAILITLCTAGLGAIVYIVLWVQLPRDTDSDAPYEVTPESAESVAFGLVDCETGRAVNRADRRSWGSISLVARMAIAIGLMLLFLVVAVGLSPMLPGTEWWQFWPISLIIAGLCLIVIPIPTQYEAAWHALGIVVTSVAATMLPIGINVISWETLHLALVQGWPFIVAAVVMFAFGIYRKSDALIIGASFLIVAFCVFALTMCVVPGDSHSLLLNIPDGRSMEIAFSLR